MKNVVIISGHPDLKNSCANKTILEEISAKCPQVDIRKLDYKKLFSVGGAMYIPGITTEEQKQALIDKCKKQADAIIECLKAL